MINLVLSASQQKWNKCVMGDTENVHTQVIAYKVGEILKSWTDELNILVIGQQVTEQQTGDISALRRVINISNEFIKENGGYGYHLDIHTDAGYAASGASGFYISDAGRRFISPIHRNISEISPWVDQGIRSWQGLLVLNSTIAVAGLIEVAFHDKQEEAEWIHNNVNDIADAIARGIMEALKLQKKDLNSNKSIKIQSFLHLL